MTGESLATLRVYRHLAPGTPFDEWRRDRLAEARAVIADAAHHSDSLIRLACKVLVQHGETSEECEDAERLLVVIDARRLLGGTQREDQGRAVR